MSESGSFATRFDDDDARRREEMDDELAEFPAGSLGLPEALDAIRIAKRLPKCLFEVDYIGMNIMCVQQMMGGERTFIDGGLIERPDIDQDAELNASFMGILVSAGNDALDYLRPRGVELGDLVTFVRLMPYHIEVGRWKYNNKPIYGVDLHAEDVRASFQLAERRAAGKIRRAVRYDEIDGQRVPTHHYVDEDGQQWPKAERM